MPQSHHSHSGQFCKHATGTLEDVVLEAIRQGFATFGLTEHVPRYRPQDLYPEEEGMSLDTLRAQFDAFLAEAHRLRAKYADQITLLVGLETEFITQTDMDELEALLGASGDRVEYLVGSVHHVRGIPIDFDQDTFLKSLDSFRSPASAALARSTPATPSEEHDTMEAFLCAYFDAQYELMRRFHPEVIGHFDLCRLYRPALRFSDYPAALTLIRRNIRFAATYGALFELNAAAFRKGWDAAYPGADVVEIILQEGGCLALSDDSHGPHAVGLNYHRIPEYARRVGITELWALERQPDASMNAAGRRLVPRRITSPWEHPFWMRERGTSV